MADFNQQAYKNSLKLIANFAENRLKFLESTPMLQLEAFKTFLWLPAVLISVIAFFVKEFHPSTPQSVIFIAVSIVLTVLLFFFAAFPVYQSPLHLKKPLKYAKQAHKLAKESDNPEIEFLIAFINSVEDSINKWGEIVEKQGKLIRLFRYLTILSITSFILAVIFM